LYYLLSGSSTNSVVREEQSVMNIQKGFVGTAVAAMVCTVSAIPTFATDALQGGVTTNKLHNGTYLQTHPKVKGAAVGGVAGAAVGGAAGLLTGKGMMRGAAIGTGAGAGIGVIQTSKTMKKHPLVKDTAIGTAAGAGLALAVTRGHGKGKRALEAGALGGALGLGAGFLKSKLK
jgi:hypothetical protein